LDKTFQEGPVFSFIFTNFVEQTLSKSEIRISYLGRVNYAVWPYFFLFSILLRVFRQQNQLKATIVKQKENYYFSQSIYASVI